MANRESASEQNTSKWALCSFQKQKPLLPKSEAYCFCCQKRQKGKFQYAKVVRRQLAAGGFCWQLQFGGRLCLPECSPQHLSGFIQHQQQHLEQLGQQESSSIFYLVHESFRNRAGVCSKLYQRCTDLHNPLRRQLKDISNSTEQQQDTAAAAALQSGPAFRSGQELQVVKQQLAAKEQQLVELKQQLDDMIQQRDQAQAALRQWQSDYYSLAQQHQQLQQNSQQLQAEHSQLQADFQSLSAAHRVVQQQHGMCHRQVAEEPYDADEKIPPHKAARCQGNQKRQRLD